MEYRLQYAAIRDTQRSAIHVVRVRNATLTPTRLEEIAERLRERLSTRGETLANVVVIQGRSKATLQLYGDPYSVSRVRSAIFGGQVCWKPFSLD